LGQLRHQLQVAQNQRLNDERTRAGAALHERHELLRVVGRDDFAEPGDHEHGAEHGLDECASGKCGVAAPR